MKNLLLSIASGLLLWLAWPTYGFAGLLFIAFVPLLLAERNIRLGSSKKPGRKVWLLAYLSFVIWNFATTSWLYFSTPFGMFFAVLVNALLMSLVFLFYHFVAKRTTQGAALSFLASLWILFEYLHLHWDFSWPWLNLGNGFSEYTNWIQWYEFTGAFGGSLWVWLVNIAIFLWWLRFRESENQKITRKHVHLIFGLTIIVLPIIVSYILKPAEDSLSSKSIANVLIVQPNVDPYEEKFETENAAITDSLITLIKSGLQPETDVIVAPETVLAEDLRISQVERDNAVIKLKTLVNDHGNAGFIGGVSLFDIFYDSERKTSQSNTAPDGTTFYDVYNSAMLVNQNRPIELYHKSKLVVGVENFPYKSLLEPILGDVMLDLGGTVATKTTQEERSVFKIQDSIAAAPIICYESVYGEYVTDYVKNGANMLAIITNDGWWGNTQGHKQHLSLARLRAIENRRFVARSANTGISAIIDHRGEIKQQLGYEKKGTLNGSVFLNDEMTFYTTHGDYIVRVAGFIAIFTFSFSVFKRGTMKRK